MLLKQIRFWSVTCVAAVAIQFGWMLPLMTGSRGAMAAMAAMALAVILLPAAACASGFFRDIGYCRNIPGRRAARAEGQEQRT